jgi:hypothetical protein
MFTQRSDTNKATIITPSSSTWTRTYVAFFELPVPLVLVVLWVAGVVLEGLVVVALYEGGLILLRYLGGII